MNLPLLLSFTRQDLIDRYSGSILGGAWSFIMPLVNMLIFILVFSRIMGARLEALGQEFSEYSYSIYLVAGMLAWNAFANTVQRATNIYREKAGLIGKVKISLISLPFYILLTESVIYLISLVFFAVFLILIDFPVDRFWLLIPVIFVIQQLFAYALGFMMAIFNVFVHDTRELVTVIVQLWFWLTPIVYVTNVLPDSVQTLFGFNPMYILIQAYRDLILYHREPSPEGLFWVLLLGLTILSLALFLFKKLERDIRDFI